MVKKMIETTAIKKRIRSPKISHKIKENWS
jgi:hypothetical protein